MSLTQGKDAADLGMAFYIALLSATLGRTIGAQLVVLGQISLHGVLSRVEGLGDKLRVAMDAGAGCVLIPTENSRDFATLPAEVLDKLRIEFYTVFQIHQDKLGSAIWQALHEAKLVWYPTKKDRAQWVPLAPRHWRSDHGYGCSRGSQR